MTDDEATPPDQAVNTQGPGEATPPDQAVNTQGPGEATPPDQAVNTQGPSGVTPEVADDPTELDLERVARDLDGVEAALARLDHGTYWTDELTGEPIPDAVLAADPVARRTEGPQ